jgi:hypothetical protein
MSPVDLKNGRPVADILLHLPVLKSKSVNKKVLNQVLLKEFTFWDVRIAALVLKIILEWNAACISNDCENFLEAST